MGLLRVTDFIDHCYTNSDGDKIKQLILNELDSGTKVDVSFQGVDSVSSSFINSAFIELLECYSFDHLKNHLGFVNTTRPINDAIKRRFKFEVLERKKLINV